MHKIIDGDVSLTTVAIFRNNPHDEFNLYDTIMTGAEIMALIRAARQVRNSSYAPHSDFNVGAAINMAVGTGSASEQFVGTNVENAAFGSTICAERAAVLTGISAGCRELRAVAVAGTFGANTPTSPCGCCRQFMHEFGGDNCLVLMPADDDSITITTLGFLLPMAFSSKDLGMDPSTYVAGAT